jgi:hypothetical protein
MDHLYSGGVPYRYISNSTVGSLSREEGAEGGMLVDSSSSESSDGGEAFTIVGGGNNSSGERINSSLELDKGSGNDSLKSRARLVGRLLVPLALMELARDVLSVLTMLWLRASSTRRSSAE